METDDMALLRESLDGILRDTQPGRVDEALTNFGWRELLEQEPSAAVSILFELQGRRVASSSALDISTAFAAGTEDAGVVYATLASATPSSVATVSDDAVRVEIRGVVAARPEAPNRVLVPATLDGRAVLVHAAWQSEWPTSGTGVAPEAGWAKLATTLEVEHSELITDPAKWRAFRAAGHRALTHELIGLGATMLELAVDHVESRTQFGKPLGSFQAVQHQLADVRLWLECATLAAQAAWEPTDGHEAAVAATIAKVTANRLSETARRHCQQVLGGMGFTWEHDFHRYLKRALLLEPLLGSTEALHTELGGQLRSGALPRLAML